MSAQLSSPLTQELPDTLCVVGQNAEGVGSAKRSCPRDIHI